jgi:hypothetical protein
MYNTSLYLDSVHGNVVINYEQYPIVQYYSISICPENHVLYTYLETAFSTLLEIIHHAQQSFLIFVQGKIKREASLSSRIVRQLRHSSLVKTFRHVHNLFPLGMIPNVQPLHMYFEISNQNTPFFSTHESTQHATFLSVKENAMNSILFITDSFHA